MKKSLLAACVLFVPTLGMLPESTAASPRLRPRPAQLQEVPLAWQNQYRLDVLTNEFDTWCDRTVESFRNEVADVIAGVTSAATASDAHNRVTNKAFIYSRSRIPAEVPYRLRRVDELAAQIASEMFTAGAPTSDFAALEASVDLVKSRIRGRAGSASNQINSIASQAHTVISQLGD